MLHFTIIILFVVFLSKYVSTTNYYTFHSVSENPGHHGKYIRPAISENGYLYIMTGEDEDIAGYTRNRYIVKFDINSGNFIEQISYKSQYGFWRGEFIFAGSNSEYLIITTFNAGEDKGHSFEFFNIKKSITKEIEYKVYGYRRVLKKIGYYYIYFFLKEKTNRLPPFNSCKWI